jgi:hypothetical protein
MYTIIVISAGGQQVLSKPSADSFAVSRRQKLVKLGGEGKAKQKS